MALLYFPYSFTQQETKGTDTVLSGVYKDQIQLKMGRNKTANYSIKGIQVIYNEEICLN